MLQIRRCVLLRACVSHQRNLQRRALLRSRSLRAGVRCHSISNPETLPKVVVFAVHAPNGEKTRYLKMPSGSSVVLRKCTVFMDVLVLSFTRTESSKSSDLSSICTQLFALVALGSDVSSVMRGKKVAMPTWWRAQGQPS